MIGYDSIVRFKVAASALVFCGILALDCRSAQDGTAKDQAAHATEPHYDETFSGSIVDMSQDRITVSRSVLGKPAEKKTFRIKADTQVEGKLRLKAKVTVGFVTADEGDVARLIVVRTDKKK